MHNNHDDNHMYGTTTTTTTTNNDNDNINSNSNQDAFDNSKSSSASGRLGARLDAPLQRVGLNYNI